MTAHTPAIEEHPDIAALRLEYERTAETPTAQVADGLTLLTGLWLAMSPWVVGFAAQTGLTVSNFFCGVAVSLLALGFAAAYGRTHGITWVVPIIGVWTILAPYVVSGPIPGAGAQVNNIITGALLVVLPLAMMALGLRRTRGAGLSPMGGMGRRP